MTKRFTPETLAIISGLLLTLSFPPFDMFFIAWVAWIPLWVALQQGGWQRGFKLGYITGFVFTLTSLNWIANNSGTNIWVASASMVGSVAYLSLWFGLFGLIIARTGNKLGDKGSLVGPGFLGLNRIPLQLSWIYPCISVVVIGHDSEFCPSTPAIG
jgi:Apolipoprotein N-acyltransferase